MLRFFQNLRANGQGEQEPEHLIELRNVVKAYKTDAGDFLALKGINLAIDEGEFVGIIGKSGSGKSTLINMLTGIDRPTSGEIYINRTGIHRFDEGQMARWRGRNQGVIFQFFQLLPTLTVIENVMLPMDFCNMYTPRQRQERAMHLLELVDVAEQAHKLPSQISGGQQQRVAIARALANDPPMIMADEPTGNLDSRTARQVFNLFEKLVAEGKTFLMVTHDDDLARRVNRTIVIADGEIVNEWLVKALPTLSQELLVKVTRQLQVQHYAPGEPIILQDTEPDHFYILCKGVVHVYLDRPNGREIFVEALEPGQYFGEMALLQGGTRRATVRAARDNPVEVVALDRDAFFELIQESEETHESLRQVVNQRSQQIEGIR
ncbi:MAG TPA: ATP-binding cassette domain-containing protein [Spirillospora sp.]|nr:ATP-binding cassette domain-containing protein [Spirillospora sp.]